MAGSGSSIEKAEVHTVENGGAVTRKQKTGRHCKRFWWAYLIGVIVFLVVLVIIIIFAIIPAVAQNKVNKSKLTLDALEIKDASAEKFTVSMKSTIETGGGISKKTKLDPMTVQLYIKGLHDPIQPFMYLNLPEIQNGGDVPVNLENYVVDINKETSGALDEFAAALMGNVTLKLSIKGKTKLRLGSLKMNVDYNEDVETAGLNHLDGMVITQIKTQKNTTANMVGDVMIPNPSVFTLHMGDVGLTIGNGQAVVGNGTLPNLTLRPGNNTYPFLGLVGAENVASVARLALTGGKLVIGSTGSYVDGKKVPWLSKPLEAMTLLVPVDMGH